MVKLNIYKSFLSKPIPLTTVLAVDERGLMQVWVQCIKYMEGKHKFIIRKEPEETITYNYPLNSYTAPKTLYMNKHDGRFEHDSRQIDLINNSFDSIEEAIRCFEQFYSY